MPVFKAPPGLKRLEKKLKDVENVLEIVSATVAEEFIDLIKQGFREQRDPYGTPWKPKQAQDGRNTLTGPTGRLKNSWHVKSMDKKGFEVSSDVDYARYHQRGHRRLPKRMMVPTRRRALPRAWKTAIEEAATDALVEHFKGNVPTPKKPPPTPKAPAPKGATTRTRKATRRSSGGAGGGLGGLGVPSVPRLDLKRRVKSLLRGSDDDDED